MSLSALSGTLAGTAATIAAAISLMYESAAFAARVMLPTALRQWSEWDQAAYDEALIPARSEWSTVPRQEGCKFCDVVERGETVLGESANFRAVKNFTQHSQLSVLVIPKNHIDSVMNMRKEHMNYLLEAKELGLEVMTDYITSHPELNLPSEDISQHFHIPPWTSVKHLHLHNELGKFVGHAHLKFLNNIQAEDILAAGGVITCAETRLPVSVADTATEQKNSPRDNKSAFADSDDDGQ